MKYCGEEFRMVCNCYYNGWDFKVGRKWLTIMNAERRIKESYPLAYYIDELAKIKEKYDSFSAARTYHVVHLFDEPEEE